MTPRPLVLAAATLLHAGCISPDNISLTIVRDSAGIVMAESPLEASGDEWRLQLPPVLLIGRSEGTGEGPDLFGRINQVIRLSSGDIAVAEGLAAEIRVFDDGGGHLRTFGRRGEGPGEFANLVGHDRSGSVCRIVRANRIPRAVTQAEIDESRAAAGERLGGMSGPAIDRIRATEFASTHPLHGRFLFDEAGNLWVERYWGDLIADSGGREWDIFDADGRLTGSLTTPGGFRITYIGTQSVLGVHADSLGIETVRMYRLNK